MSTTPILFDPLLSLAADVVDDLESNRIANENRLRQLTRTEPDEDGEMRGFGLDVTNPNVARLSAIVDSMREMEHAATLNLQRAMKAHALGPWVQETRGVGLKQAARLLACIGDPYWNTLHERPRTVSELWSYCGMAVTPEGNGPRRRKGMKVNWNPDARMRVRMIAESIVKAGGPYRLVYDERKADTEGRVHAVECPQCVGSSKVGEPWRPGHRHADALRVVGKEVLKDMWLEARRIHQEREG